MSVHMMLELARRFRVWIKVLHPLEASLQTILAGRRACCPVEGTHEASQRETGNLDPLDLSFRIALPRHGCDGLHAAYLR